MLRLRRLLPFRRLAALFAMSGLLALPLRPLLACPMLAAPVVQASADHAAMDHDAMEHDHAAMEQEQATAEHGSTPAPHGPDHDVCPDVAHCVAVVLRDCDALLPPQVLATADAGGELPTRPASAGRTLDTPPPKQA